jgi:hypothetical protein
MYISTKNYSCTHQQSNCFDVITFYYFQQCGIRFKVHSPSKSNQISKETPFKCVLHVIRSYSSKGSLIHSHDNCASKNFFFYNKLKLLLTCTSVRSVFNILHSPKLMHAPVTEGAAYPWQAEAGASCCIATFES